MKTALVLAILVSGYLLPTLIAYKRRHDCRGWVLFVNLLLGWNGMWWFYCFVWSIIGARDDEQYRLVLVKNTSYDDSTDPDDGESATETRKTERSAAQIIPFPVERIIRTGTR